MTHIMHVIRTHWFIWILKNLYPKLSHIHESQSIVFNSYYKTTIFNAPFSIIVTRTLYYPYIYYLISVIITKIQHQSYISQFIMAIQIQKPCLILINPEISLLHLKGNSNLGIPLSLPKNKLNLLISTFTIFKLTIYV